MSHAYIFDFDGVLVNTMPAHFAAYRQALAEVNVPLDERQFYRQAGMTGREQIRSFADKAGVAIDVERVYARTREIHRTLTMPTEVIACNVELLRLLRRAGVLVASASGSSRPSILPIMHEHGIEADAIVTAEDIQRGKPFPDLFLRAAEALHALPADCVVIEDSDVGIEAARAAGMQALRFYRKLEESVTDLAGF
jgi:HAD superfamily hydrolase (TIGR01509 family)